jgi:tetratricopeptide (TPR) repeat protein
MKRIFTFLLACAITTTLFSQNRISFDPDQLRTTAMQNFINKEYFDCMVNLQRLTALGYDDGLVNSLMVMAYDSLNNQKAMQAMQAERNKYTIDSNKLKKMFSPDYNPDLYKQWISNQGVAYFNAKRYDSSAYYFTKYLEQMPKDTFALFYLASSHFYLKDYKSAIENYKKVLEIDFNRPNVHNYLGIAYMGQNNYLNARDHFSQAVLLDKNLTGAYYNLGKVQYGLNDYAGAITALNKAMETNPRDKEVLNLLGNIYTEQKDNAGAEMVYEKLYAVEKNNEKTNWILANLALQSKSYERAEYYLTNIVRINPKSVDGYQKLGAAYIADKKWNEAYLNYEQAVTKVGENKDLLVNAGYSANKIKLHNKAVEYLNKALLQDPANAAAEYQMGVAYEGLKKKKDAKKHYQMATAMDPNIAKNFN